MSPSQLQSETARINGSQSRGPVTQEGKAVSAMNALRHGLCSKKAVLPGEDPEKFEQHRQGYIQHYKPQGKPEQDLVEVIAITMWRKTRIMHFETALLSAEDADLMKALSLIARYENQLNRDYREAAQALKELQENRPKPVSQTAPSGSFGEATAAPPAQNRDREGAEVPSASIGVHLRPDKAA